MDRATHVLPRVPRSIFLAVAVAVLVAFPVSAAPVLSASAHLPSPGPTASRHSVAAEPVAGFAGAAGSVRKVDGPAIYRADHTVPFALPSEKATAPGRAQTPPPAWPPALRPGTPGPAAGGGWLNGTVLDSLYGTPVAGASVSISAGLCTYCSGGTTNASGYFSVEGDAGPAVVQVTDNGYLDNRTFPTVVLGVFTSIGVMLLFHKATVEGTVVADLPGFPPLSNASVSSFSRDGGQVGPNATLTSRNGSFELAVDPIPIEVDVGAPNPYYVGNTTFVDPTPWEVINVHEIALEGGVILNLSVVDAVTHAGLNASASFCSDRLQDACLASVAGSGGYVEFPAVAGPGTVSVAAGGYVTNVTQLPDVPSGTAGPVRSGTVELVPDGAIQLTVNMTGGTPDGTWPSALPNETSVLEVVVESLSGELSAGGTAIHLGQTVLLAAPPLRDVVYIARAGGEDMIPPGFPLAELPLPAILGTLKMLNVTWANVTPDGLTNVGSVDISPGTYLSGSVVVSGGYATRFNSSATITVCSVVRGGECLPPVQTGVTGPIGAIPTGCPTAAWTFCAPAPPGPDHVQISWGGTENGTWVTVPTRCCAQEGHPTPIGAFGMTATLGSVYGTVGVEGAPLGTVPRGYGSGGGVSVCPSDPRVADCFQTSYSPTNGTFFVAAPLGWDDITAQGFNYRSNSTWVDVTGNNSTGTIEIGPFAFVGGQVLSAATGYPLLEAQITACLVAVPVDCHGIGGTYGSNGTYNGSTAAVPYPGNAYAFQASASGYDPETTYVNLTPGALTTVPTLRLSPIGVLATPYGLRARSANSSAPTTGSWVTGRIVDARSGLAVGGAQVNLCYLGSGGCGLSSAYSLDDGRINLTTVHGAYEVWVNATHYATDLLYLNASVAGTVALGAVGLTPLDRITGRVDIGPWPNLSASYGMGADDVQIVGCTQKQLCGPTEPTNSGGFFNVSVPAGVADTISFQGGGLVNSGNSLPGYSPIVFAYTISSTYTPLTGSGPGGALVLPILGGLSGFVSETSGTLATRAAAYFTTYGAPGNSSVGPSVAALTGGGGAYVAFLPDGAVGEHVQANALGLVPASSGSVGGTTASGRVVPGPNLTLARFGFLTATIFDSNTQQPVGGIGLTVNGVGGPTNGPLSGSATSNGTGAVNVSAPPGNVGLSAGNSAYANWTGSASVTSGNLSVFGRISIAELAGGGVVVIRTAEVNSLGGPPTPGAYDNVSGHPVEATLAVEDSGNGIHAGPSIGNDLGQFFLTGYPSSAANFSVTAAGFAKYQVGVDLPIGSTDVLPQLNLTADGIVAGTVVAEPGNVSVPFATVLVCPLAQPFCPNLAQTNASGVYWAGAAAGLDSVTVESSLYLANTSQIVNVTPDSFTEVGAISVFGSATVRGVVRGLPSGAILPGASVSICSMFSPSNGCLPDETVTTDANGTFTVQSPPGSYVFYATAPGYNATRYTLALAAGANVSLGIVFLEAYGLLAGQVVTTTGAPVVSALVLACGAWGGGGCGPQVTTASDGTFVVAATPGPVGLTVTKSGYLDGTTSVTALSGEVVAVPTIVLEAEPPNILETVSGTVRSAATGGPLPGTLLVAKEGGTRVAQTLSQPDGTFSLNVRWGTAELFVGVANYAPQNRTLAVHSNVSGLTFSLAAMTYLVRGVTTDGGTHGVLAGVVIADNLTELALSDRNGAFSFRWPNGTAHLVASLATTGTVQYGRVPFALTVDGGSVLHNLSLPRTIVPLGGEVVDAVTGQAIRDASVQLWSGSGTPLGSAATNASGEFGFAVAPGQYNVSASARGYAGVNVSVHLGPTGNHSAIALVPVGPTASSTTKIPLSVVLLGGAVAVAALAAAGILLWRRRRPPATPGVPVDAEYRMVEGPSTLRPRTRA